MNLNTWNQACDKAIQQILAFNSKLDSDLERADLERIKSIIDVEIQRLDTLFKEIEESKVKIDKGFFAFHTSKLSTILGLNWVAIALTIGGMCVSTFIDNVYVKGLGLSCAVLSTSSLGVANHLQTKLVFQKKQSELLSSLSKEGLQQSQTIQEFISLLMEIKAMNQIYSAGQVSCKLQEQEIDKKIRAFIEEQYKRDLENPRSSLTASSEAMAQQEDFSFTETPLEAPANLNSTNEAYFNEVNSNNSQPSLESKEVVINILPKSSSLNMVSSQRLTPRASPRNPNRTNVTLRSSSSQAMNAN